MKNTFTLILYICCAFFSGNSLHAQIILSDIFNRNLANQTIILTDWEGYMANPATRLTVKAPANAAFPVFVNITANGSLLYFDMPSSNSSAGPSKTIVLNDTKAVSFYISDFPDRDTVGEKYVLSISTSQYGQQQYNIQVKDQDLVSTNSSFKITVNYSEDTVYHFFNTTRKNIVQTACNDWAYFINNGNFDSVAAGAQDAFIWTDNYAGGHFTYNPVPYKGYYLYAYGIRVDPMISGGGPSTDNFQTISGVSTELRRAGAYNADPRGNYNSLGWNTSIQDSTWYLATNLGDVPNDLYSISHHEIGHALNFNPGYPQFDFYKQQGYIDFPEVVSYERQPVYIDIHDHLQDSTGNLLTDRISRKGAFGSEYANAVPYGRWLITKLDLLVLKAVGYNLKTTSAFVAPKITTTSLPSGHLNSPYNASVAVKGGIPFYKFYIISQSLPPGLTLNSFTGIINGTPTQAGTFSFKVRVYDYDSVSAQKQLSITISSTLKNSIASVDNSKEGFFIIDPNPASAFISLHINGSMLPLYAEISSEDGKEYMRLSGQQLTQNIPIHSLPAGICFVDVVFQNNVHQRKSFLKTSGN